MGDFTQLAVYRRACDAADEIRTAVLAWPSFDRWTIGAQLVRAADSVAANIAEAGGRHSLGDERRFMLIARGSAYETEHWLGRAQARELRFDPALIQELREISRMITPLARRRASED